MYNFNWAYLDLADNGTELWICTSWVMWDSPFKKRLPIQGQVRQLGQVKAWAESIEENRKF